MILMHSQLWWPDDDTTSEGTKLEEPFTKLGLSQLISEPTNFELHKNPLCIDLVVTDQPNILGNGTQVHCKINFRIPHPPLFERKIWHFKRSVASFPWHQ